MEENYVKGYFELVSQTTMSLPLIAWRCVAHLSESEKLLRRIGRLPRGGNLFKGGKRGNEFYRKGIYGRRQFLRGIFCNETQLQRRDGFFFFTVYDVAEENAQLNRGAYEMFYYGDSELNFLNFIRGESNTAVYYQNGTDYYLIPPTR